ncbi:MAG TPA: hypothetical protein VME46_10580 [Acidimicrobiales bacterium]|nr:hypothetical protein [Acidimicrobiales bacterium]
MSAFHYSSTVRPVLWALAAAAAGTSLAASVPPVVAQVLPTLHGQRDQATKQAKGLQYSSGGYLSGVSCTGARSCAAVGYNRTSSGYQSSVAERWNGSGWAPVAGKILLGMSNFTMSGVSCADANSCEAVNSSRLQAGPVQSAYLAASWDGRTWQLQQVAVPRPFINASLAAVSCATPRMCEAVGTAETKTKLTTFAAKWNGGAWSAQTTPLVAGARDPSLTGVSCLSASFCEAVGQYVGATGAITPLAEEWDGSTWEVQSSVANADARLAGLASVSCATIEDCEAVGFDLGTNSGLAEGWDGHDWARQPVSRSGTSGDVVLSSVSCAAAGVCEAVGYSATSKQLLAESWNGKTWASQGAAGPAGAKGKGPAELNSISCIASVSCEAVGDYSQGVHGWHALAEHWDGSTWSDQTIQ